MYVHTAVGERQVLGQAMPNSEEIKPVALFIVEWRHQSVSQSVSQRKLVLNKFHRKLLEGFRVTLHDVMYS